MGANVESAPNGCAPFTVTGPLKTGEVTVDCPVSQYLSALLLAAPLITDGAAEVSQINVRTLNEAPYVGITLDWLEGQGIRYERKDWEEFRIPAGQSYRPFEKVVPADWSSATFFLVAAAITGGTLVLEGLDTADSQGDKAVVGMLEAMGCQSEEVPGGLRIIGRPLSGTVLDLNATPDALPAMAVAGCYAEGETRLVNVPQARLKETDRITVMTTELMKLGADVEELPDGMVIRGRRPAMESCVSPVLKGALVDGHDDHRVVMALAVAALGCCGQVSIRGAEAADITFPGFFKLLDKALDRNGK
jgi:3-phosphoshikimate 1-carboxyvinyltransferase